MTWLWWTLGSVAVFFLVGSVVGVCLPWLTRKQEENPIAAILSIVNHSLGPIWVGLTLYYLWPGFLGVIVIVFVGYPFMASANSYGGLLGVMLGLKLSGQWDKVAPIR